MQSSPTPPQGPPRDPGSSGSDGVRPAALTDFDTAAAAVDRLGTPASLTRLALLRTPEQAELLVGLARLGDQIEGLRSVLLHGAEEVAVEDGSPTVASWLARQTKNDTGRYTGEARQGAAYEQYPATRDAVLAGRATVKHAVVITDACTSLFEGLTDPEIAGDLVLPDGATPASLVAKAERVLLGYVDDFPPKDLKVLGERILHAIAPAVADLYEGRLLEREEAAARKKTSFRLRDLGHGMKRATIVMPTLAASILSTALDAYTNPRRDHLDTSSSADPSAEQQADPSDGQQAGPSVEQHDGPSDGQAGPTDGGQDGPSVEQRAQRACRNQHPTDTPNTPRIPRERRLGQAFCALLEHLPTDGLPTHGRTPVTVTVTLAWEKLKAHLGVATLSTGESISAGEARRLACSNGILPAVLGGASEVLDLGRSRRFYSTAQTKAMRIVQKTCAARGCTVPAAWCEAHHVHPWSEGGCTDLCDGRLLCSHDHHLIHDPAYEHTWHPDGSVSFHRKT